MIEIKTEYRIPVPDWVTGDLFRKASYIVWSHKGAYQTSCGNGRARVAACGWVFRKLEDAEAAAAELEQFRQERKSPVLRKPQHEPIFGDA